MTTTIEQLHESVDALKSIMGELLEEVREIKKSEKLRTVLQRDMLDVEDAATFLRVSPGRLRCMASEGTVPYYKAEKRIYFSRKELEAMRQRNRHASIAEMIDRADAIQASKRARRS